MHQSGPGNDGFTNEGTRTMFQFNDSLALEVSIGAGHGIGIDHQVFGHFTDARELLASPYRTRFNGVLHLFDELKIKGDSRRRIQAQYHRLFAVLVQYTHRIGSFNMNPLPPDFAQSLAADRPASYGHRAHGSPGRRSAIARSLKRIDRRYSESRISRAAALDWLESKGFRRERRMGRETYSVISPTRSTPAPLAASINRATSLKSNSSAARTN